MNLDFAAAIATLNRESDIGDAAFEVANDARSPGDYLFAQILPEINMPDYAVHSGNMTVRATMAGLVGMDSPYPTGGLVEMSTFLEQTAKIAIEVGLTEQALRSIQNFVMRLMAQGQPTNEVAVNEALNFLNLVIIQPLLDTNEWLRGQVLQHGQINWNFNKRSLVVDYGVPAANFLATRTVAANTYYGGTASKFWDDIRSLRKQVGRVRAFIAHPDTIDMARFNPANGMATIAEGENTVTFRRFARDAGGAVDPRQFSLDASEQVTFITYAKEAEILDLANPGQSLIVPFLSTGKVIAIGDVSNNGYQPGMGSQDTNLDPRRLGYTHIAPTVEGGGRTGRWAQLYVPENAPWSLRGRAAENVLPVLEAPNSIAVATTEMA